MDNNRVTKDTRLFEDACHIIEQSRDAAYRSVNIALLRRNWELGRRIDEEILNGENRAEYGAGIIKELSKELTNRYGKGFTKSNLYSFLRFSRFFPQIFQSKIGKSQELLHWTHYSLLINIDDADAREWYAHEAFAENWKVSTLRRNIASQYYYRLLQSQDKDGVKREMLSITSNQNPDKLEFIKNPVIAEFLGLSSNNDFYESELESSIITHLEKFLLELGKGYAFVARQKHISTDMGDFFIDLVFYNYILKCFLLIDLKTTQISYQDVEQMDMYVRMFDELQRHDGDNPTIGLILCSQTSKDMAKYSILSDSNQIFQARYLTYLPTEEELRNEIEHQKEVFMLQRKGGGE